MKEKETRERLFFFYVFLMYTTIYRARSNKNARAQNNVQNKLNSKWWLKAALQENEKAIKYLKVKKPRRRKNNTHPSLLRDLWHTQNNQTSIECMQSMPHDTLLQP